MKVLCLILLAAMNLGAAPLKRIVGADGDVVAVVVPAGTKLAHTRQDVTADPLVPLAAMTDAVKVNVVARDLPTAENARKAIRHAYDKDMRPAVSVVLGTVRDDQPLAIDAVLAVDGADHRPRVFISGQAEKAASPAEATARTLASLLETLKFTGCTIDDVAQAKCFLTPMSAHADVAAEFKKVFGDRTLSLVFVEWKSDLPVEIELVASGPPAPADAPAIEYLTPPGKTPSPLFARIVRVNRGDLIYVGDLYSAEPGNGQQQVLSIFEQLADALKRTNSDLRHLAKATYFVSDADASKQHNLLRPKFFDPARPPAASKAMVPGIGMAGRSISFDMIAIPATLPATTKP